LIFRIFGYSLLLTLGFDIIVYKLLLHLQVNCQCKILYRPLHTEQSLLTRAHNKF